MTHETPTLQTSRLILRPLALSDAPAIQRHFNNWNIISISHRLSPGHIRTTARKPSSQLQLEKIAAGEEIYHWVLVLRSR